MSPTNRFLTVGLTALGLLGSSASSFAVAGEPQSVSSPPSAPAPATPAPDAGQPRVLLLYNGEHLTGEITENAKSYVIHRNGGEIHVAKDRVEEAFSTIQELYQYKLNQIPERDPDEHLKLARWCLSQHLTAEAKASLQIVLKLSPKAGQARAMLVSIQNAETRQALAKNRDVDTDVMQSRAEMTIPTARRADRPSELDDAVIRKAQKEFGLTGLPVIFELPAAMAVKRADQFTKSVQPILQVSCVRCHNETSNRVFQLVEIKNRREQTSEISRANLDAVLQFVNRDNPAKSEILSTVLLPHGGGRVPRPVFRGSNDPKYQILSAWVNSLRPSTASNSLPRVDAQPIRIDLKDSDFGIDRANGVDSASPAPVPMEIGFEAVSIPRQEIPPFRYTPGKGFKFETKVPGPEEFPKPLAVGGTLPKRLKSRTEVVDEEVVDDPQPGPPRKKKSLSRSEREIVEIPPGELDPSTVDPLKLAKAQAAELSKGSKASKPKAKVKIDPALLERALMNRAVNAPR